MSILKRRTKQKLADAVALLNADPEESEKKIKKTIFFKESTFETPLETDARINGAKQKNQSEAISLLDSLPHTKQSKNISKIKKSALSPELFNKFVQSVKESTMKLNTKGNVVRIIDDANNLIVFKGQMKQPFRSINDIYCQLFVNDKEISPCDENYKKIIEYIRGDVIIVS